MVCLLPILLAAAAASTANAKLFGSSLSTPFPVAFDRKVASRTQQSIIPSYLELRGGASGEAGVATDSEAAISISGPFGNVLEEARLNARLLVVYIPAKSKSKAAKKNNDAIISALDSPLVLGAANKPSRRKGDKKLGSFFAWTPSSNSEAASAMKRLKVKYPKNNASPILLVAYVAQAPVIDRTTGRPRLVPKVLAQHHCNPPPSSQPMASWLDALRKRHAKQYAAMQHQLKEAALYEERKKGYVSSQKDDRDREEKERQAKAEKKAKEEEERKRKEEIERRRAELLESLPDEPEATAANVITIALRFADGRTGRRRFEGEEEMQMVFNWVDASFGMERERVELSTMTGQKNFTYGGVAGKSLIDSGLGKMTGLRVAEIDPLDTITGEKEEGEGDDNDCKEVSEDSDDDDEEGQDEYDNSDESEE